MSLRLYLDGMLLYKLYGDTMGLLKICLMVENATCLM